MNTAATTPTVGALGEAPPDDNGVALFNSGKAAVAPVQCRRVNSLPADTQRKIVYYSAQVIREEHYDH